MRVCPCLFSIAFPLYLCVTQALEDAVQDLFPEEGTARMLAAKTIEGVGEYRAFGFKSAFGEDVAE